MITYPMRVVMTLEAAKQAAALPRVIKGRVMAIVEKLRSWPAVSGAKPLRGELVGHYRIRTGDYRIVFTVKDNVVIIKVAHRRDVYEK